DRIVDLERLAVRELDLVDDRGRGRDQFDVELALQTLLDDLEMQEPKEAAAEAKAERGRGLHLEGEARIVEPELRHRCAQLLELRRVHRKESAEDDRLRRPEAGEHFGGRLPVVGDGV